MLVNKNKKKSHHLQQGFTLIELVTVVVILSILAVVGSSFMIRTAEGYQQTQNRTQLIQRGRLSIERLTRELRNAVPNSIRVSANNLCIEWLPIVGGGNYLGELPDQDNGAAATSSIDTGPITFENSDRDYVSVGALNASDIYGNAPPSLALFSSIDQSAIPNQTTLTAAKIFERNSVNRRIYFASRPKQACISSEELSTHGEYTTSGNYPSASALTGTPPNAGQLLSEGITVAGEIPFAISSGSMDRNTLVQLQIPFEKGGERIVLSHQIMVRNVP